MRCLRDGFDLFAINRSRMTLGACPNFQPRLILKSGTEAIVLAHGYKNSRCFSSSQAPSSFPSPRAHLMCGSDPTPLSPPRTEVQTQPPPQNGQAGPPCDPKIRQCKFLHYLPNSGRYHIEYIPNHTSLPPAGMKAQIQLPPEHDRHGPPTKLRPIQPTPPATSAGDSRVQKTKSSPNYSSKQGELTFVYYSPPTLLLNENSRDVWVHSTL